MEDKKKLIKRGLLGCVLLGCVLLAFGCMKTVKGHYYNLQADQYYDGDRKQQAFEMYYQSAGNGVADAQYMVSQMLLSGDGVRADTIEGLRWLEKAAAQDHIEAARDLGFYLLDGTFGRPREPQRGILFLERAAAGNDSFSMMALGYLNFTGYVIPRNPQAAAHWFGLAAQNGESIPGEWQDAGYLNSATPPAAYNAKAEYRARVRRAQTGLKALGYYKSSLDGLPGRGTDAAVKQFQKDQQLEVNGQIDVALMRRLYRCIVFDPLNRRM